MSTWSTISFCDANSPTIEQLIFFHDHTIIIIIIITTLITYIILNIILRQFTNRYLIEDQTIEIIWTVIPTIILLFIALPSLRILYLIEETFEPSLTIKIIGHQWYWSYEISNFNIEFDSFIIPDTNLSKNNFRLLDVDNRLVIPYNTHLSFIVSSADVIHSWRVPSIGIKVDAIPGRLNQIGSFLGRPGIFFGQCSEICGANHSFMPISVESTSINNFFTWVDIFFRNGW